MKSFVLQRHLEIYTLIGLVVVIWLILSWAEISQLQHLTGLLFIATVAHEWEEQRLPGGFTEMMARKIGYENDVPQVAHLPVYLGLMLVAFMPLVFPDVLWLSLASAYLGIYEAFIHAVGIRIHRTKRPYTPGLLTGWVCMLPLAILVIINVATTSNATVDDWVLGLVYMGVCFAAMQLCTLKAIGLTPKSAAKHLLNK